MMVRPIAAAALIVLSSLQMASLTKANSAVTERGMAGVTLTFVGYPADQPGFANFRLSNMANSSIYFSGRSLSEPMYVIYLPDDDYPEPTQGWRPAGPAFCGNGVHVVELGAGAATDFLVRADTLRARGCRLGLRFSGDEWQKTSWVVMSDVLNDAGTTTPPN